MPVYPSFDGTPDSAREVMEKYTNETGYIVVAAWDQNHLFISSLEGIVEIFFADSGRALLTGSESFIRLVAWDLKRILGEDFNITILPTS